MKEYKVVHLNPKLELTTKQDIKQSQETLDNLAKEGWELITVVSPNNLSGGMIGYFQREKQ